MNTVEEFWISLSDLKNLYLRTHRRIQKISLIIFILSLGWMLLKPVQFTSSGSFCIAQELLLYPHPSSAQNQDITPYLFSNLLLTKTLENLGWQIDVSEPNKRRKLLNQFKNTFSAEFKKPLLQKENSSFVFRHVHYDNEIPTPFYLCLLGKDKYEILDASSQLVGQGEIGKPFVSSFCQFTLLKAPNHALLYTAYPLQLLPLKPLIESIKTRLSSKKNELFFTLNFTDTNRFRSLQFLEELILSYNSLAKEEFEAKLNSQIGFLEKEMKEKKEESPQIGENAFAPISHILLSKRIEKNQIQTALKTLDAPFLLLPPKSPHIFFYSIKIYLLSCLLIYLYYFFKSLNQGFPASLETLKMKGEHTCGFLLSKTTLSLQEMAKANLETLRNIVSLLKSPQPLITTLFIGDNLNYSKILAELLSLYDKKTVILECPFATNPTQAQSLGVLQFLDHQIEALPIQKEAYFDFIPSGGNSLFATELISQKKFKQMLEQLKTQYDCILLLSTMPCASTENIVLLEYTDVAIISLESDSLEQLNPYLNWGRQKQNRCVSFVQSQVKPI